MLIKQLHKSINYANKNTIMFENYSTQSCFDKMWGSANAIKTNVNMFSFYKVFKYHNK